MNTKEREALIAQRNGTKVPENYRDYWTEDAATTLEQMYLGDGLGISEIALFFGRNELSIYQQLLKRGLMGTGGGGGTIVDPPPRCRCSKCKVRDCPNRIESYSEAQS